MTDPAPLPWHSLPVEEVLKRVASRPEGLTPEEVERRLAEYGPNRLRPPSRRGPLLRFLAQFHNVLIYVLLGASFVTALLGHWVDTGVILGVVVISAIMGFIQEGKAEKALEGIRRMLTLHATVLRDGRRRVVPAESLVPGDIVVLQSGDKIPADLRLIHVKNLQTQEAALTGESLAVEKATRPVSEDAVIGDRTCMAYSGTLVAYGQGTGVVVATGDHTELGRISSMLAEVEQLTTPLLRQIAVFGHWLTVAIIAAAAITFAFGILLREYSISEMFLAAISLAVAAIPEGLPAIMTITLAIGVQRMAHRHAIIRRLPAVETLGSVTVICSDKTGTLTRNEQTVQTVATAQHLFEVSGSGYDPKGEFNRSGETVTPANHPDLFEALRAAVLCNDAILQQVDGEWRLDGDPIEGALLVAGLKAGLDPDVEKQALPRIDLIPFASEQRFMATLHRDYAGRGVIYLKGAPERVLEMCRYQLYGGESQPLDLDNWHKCTEDMAAQGQRVLAVAFKATSGEHRELNLGDVEGDLTLLGLFGLIDPPRPEAIAAIARCQSAGIRIKMITGDHALTARAIGKQLGLIDNGGVTTGRALDDLDEDELRHVAMETHIFARTSPEHKLRLVQALQANGQVVAMTGDGVNDAPALRRADVGVAMGIKGTEVSKEAAEIVLADDNFASIAHAVEEGRTVYDNLRKALLFILPTNGGETLTLIAAILLGRTLPITPVQILWVNMITAVTLALALAFEPSEGDVMRRPPRAPKAPLLSPLLLWRIGFVSCIIVAGTFGLFLWERLQGADIEIARTVAVNTLVMFEVFYLLNARYFLAPAYTREGLSGNRYALLAIALVIVFQVLFTHMGFMQQLFGTSPIDAAAWGRVLVTAASVFALVELEKFLLRRYRYRPVNQ
ncbi:MAG TPA: cation-transporting P-type ATPase [Alphaproteobacteria bacterium]|nr:cation-transporting P-type ATPase [Alphaproteobacteria bacterium]